MQNPSGRKGVCGPFSETKKAREVHRNTGFWAGERFCMDEFEKQITEAPNLTLTSSNPANSRTSSVSVTSHHFSNPNLSR